MIHDLQLDSGKKLFFASDCHLGEPDYGTSREREKKVVSWLDTFMNDSAGFFLLGDIFDFWFERQTFVYIVFEFECAIAHFLYELFFDLFVIDWLSICGHAHGDVFFMQWFQPNMICECCVQQSKTVWISCAVQFGNFLIFGFPYGKCIPFTNGINYHYCSVSKRAGIVSCTCMTIMMFGKLNFFYIFRKFLLYKEIY